MHPELVDRRSCVRRCTRAERALAPLTAAPHHASGGLPAARPRFVNRRVAASSHHSRALRVSSLLVCHPPHHARGVPAGGWLRRRWQAVASRDTHARARVCVAVSRRGCCHLAGRTDRLTRRSLTRGSGPPGGPERIAAVAANRRGPFDAAVVGGVSL